MGKGKFIKGMQVKLDGFCKIIMKKILILLSLFIGLKVSAQTPVSPVRINQALWYLDTSNGSNWANFTIGTNSPFWVQGIPPQGTHAGQVLGTDGTNLSWVSAGGTLTNPLSLTYGFVGQPLSFTGAAAITAPIDTAVLQTVLNFFPKGDTRWIRGASNGVIDSLGILQLSNGVSGLLNKNTVLTDANGTVTLAITPDNTIPTIQLSTTTDAGGHSGLLSVEQPTVQLGTIAPSGKFTGITTSVSHILITDANALVGGVYAANYFTAAHVIPRAIPDYGGVAQLLASYQTISTGLSGSYTNSNITLDVNGRITAIANGSGGSGTVTTFSVVTANGVSASVANPTTTPAATFTLGAITPTSINTTIIPATIYQTPSGTAGTDSVLVKHSDGTVKAISPTYYGTGGGTPGGSPNQIQFNNAGVFGGVPGASWNGANFLLNNLIATGGATFQGAVFATDGLINTTEYYQGTHSYYAFYDGSGYGRLEDAAPGVYQIGSGGQTGTLGTPIMKWIVAQAETDAMGPFKPMGYTVSTLPTSPSLGWVCYVTDSLVPVIGNAVASGGSAFAGVQWNGSQWTVTSK